jgi:MoxR-like ATPase
MFCSPGCVKVKYYLYSFTTMLMISGEQTFGIVANAEKVKTFAKKIIQSNQKMEKWNTDNSEEISKGLLSNRKKVPICIWGPHGIGKTEMLKSVADELTIEEERSEDERWLFTNIAPAQFEEMGDLLGMPSIEPGLSCHH